jgi:hypothetical protein
MLAKFGLEGGTLGGQDDLVSVLAMAFSLPAVLAGAILLGFLGRPGMRMLKLSLSLCWLAQGWDAEG